MLSSEVNRDQLSPMMQLYLDTKKEYSDCILFYRLGDFYEMFFEDAYTVSKELELILTGKSCGLEERAPMCGVPFHAVDSYLSRLVQRGYKVAICEQVEDPKFAKGLVKREVTRIVTPGTISSQEALEESKNNYICSIVHLQNRIGVAFADITTGDFLETEVETNKNLYDEIMRFMPAEIICNQAFMVCGIDIDDLKSRLGICITCLDAFYFDEHACEGALLSHFNCASLLALGVGDFTVGNLASGALMQYLSKTQMVSLSQMTHITPYINKKYMMLDSSTRRNLELTETLREKQKRGLLLWVLDKPKTAMGARALRSYVEQPLIDKEAIVLRQDAIEELSMQNMDRDEIREYLNAIYDLERLLTKISYRSANPRDLIAFKTSLNMLPPIKSLLKDFKSELLNTINNDLDDLADIFSLIDNAINEDPPLSSKEGGFIKEGYNSDIDMLRKSKTDGKQWLYDLETAERERTGIKSLKIKYNKVFGYYLEVTNTFKDQVPEDYIRKQTLSNAERYTTPKLKELEDTILNAEDKLYGLEYDAFCEIRDTIELNLKRIQKTAKNIASLDAIASLSVVAEKNNYVRPSINTKGVINIKRGRHPVVEKVLSNDLFIDNDTYLDNKKHCVNIITGPNMAGKSTYMRQTAIIVLMAQMGSFVPAESADICLVDRIFTRVGASDDLASGQSTFMIEMTEVANILRNATSDSLIILDEIGRGTSTYDGLSIAWAVVEHISNKKILGAKTLFATHYHELTELEGKIDNVNNYCIAVKEKGDDIVFLRKIVAGGADKSYGIQVAKLAGVPDMVIDRAKEIVGELSANDITEKIQNIDVSGRSESKHEAVSLEEVEIGQMSFFDTVKDEDIIEEIKNLNVSNMTPLDALNTLYKLQNKLNNRWSGN